MKVASTSNPIIVRQNASTSAGQAAAANQPQDQVEINPNRERNSMIRNTIIGAGVGIGAGLLAGTRGGWVGGVSGAVAGGMGGLIVGTAGSAHVGLSEQSVGIGLGLGAVGMAAGAYFGANANLAAGVAMAVTGGACGAFMGMMSAWK